MFCISEDSHNKTINSIEIRYVLQEMELELVLFVNYVIIEKEIIKKFDMIMQ